MKRKTCGNCLYCDKPPSSDKWYCYEIVDGLPAVVSPPYDNVCLYFKDREEFNEQKRTDMAFKRRV